VPSVPDGRGAFDSPAPSSDRRGSNRGRGTGSIRLGEALLSLRPCRCRPPLDKHELPRGLVAVPRLEQREDSSLLHDGLLRRLVGWPVGIELLVVGVLLLVVLRRSWLQRRQQWWWGRGRGGGGGGAPLLPRGSIAYVVMSRRGIFSTDSGSFVTQQWRGTQLL
jgi:hypothetical protein